MRQQVWKITTTEQPSRAFHVLGASPGQALVNWEAYWIAEDATAPAISAIVRTVEVLMTNGETLILSSDDELDLRGYE